ncbi:MAG: arsenate reductase (glutaredoxin) [Gammaproteobacteria bacterium]|nr:arsenate reductase (glutaredoxin) [Gammaproteobacteria bacterium]
MSSTRIYLNPNCSKCQLSMQLLDDKGINPDVTEYLNEPPSVDELSKILDLLSMEPRELMRQHEAPYKELNLADETLSRDALIQAMVENPILIERPIVIHNGKATIGRPPEKILELL